MLEAEVSYSKSGGTKGAAHLLTSLSITPIFRNYFPSDKPPFVGDLHLSFSITGGSEGYHILVTEVTDFVI